MTNISGLPVVAISVDVALDRQIYDLSPPQVIALWKGAILVGRVLALIAGPP